MKWIEQSRRHKFIYLQIYRRSILKGGWEKYAVKKISKIPTLRNNKRPCITLLIMAYHRIIGFFLLLLITLFMTLYVKQRCIRILLRAWREYLNLIWNAWTLHSFRELVDKWVQHCTLWLDMAMTRMETEEERKPVTWMSIFPVISTYKRIA
jgi:hypothetical protein